MKNVFRTILSLLAFLFSLLFVSDVSGQTQRGSDIDGEAAGDRSGYSVSMPDPNMVAIGATDNGGNGTDAGHVRIYVWNGNAWVQKGGDIDGDTIGDLSGFAVCMPDTNTVAIGSPQNSTTNLYSGHTRIFTWNGNAWVNKGLNLFGEAAGDLSGSALWMPDANTVAIGSPLSDGNGADAGQVRIYRWDSGAWVQKGIDIDGEAAGDESGQAVCMPDSNTVAIGAWKNDGNGSNAGHARVYHWTGTAWIQKGLDIDGELWGDGSGCSLSMPDANTIAIGALNNGGNGGMSGHVRIYSWNGVAWVQKGVDIDGEALGDRSGIAVSMPDSNTVAIGADSNDGNGIQTGHVRVFTWMAGVWQQKGNDMEGEAAGDFSGFAISMPDSNTVAIGSYLNDGNGNSSGHVRIYSNGTVGLLEPATVNNIAVYPNPTRGDLMIDFGSKVTRCTIMIRGDVGHIIQKHSVTDAHMFQIALPEPSGIYMIEVHTNHESAHWKVIKN